MSKGSYTFQIGEFECIVLHDSMFLPPNLKYRQTDKHNTIDYEKMTDLNVLLIKTGNKTILCDTGMGAIPDPECGHLSRALEDIGMQPDQIDTVLLSHGHGDHICGLMGPDQKPSFPNAHYIMFMDEWTFWTADPELKNLDDEDDKRKMFAEIVKHNLLPIQDNITLLDSDTEILPGIEVKKAAGHTPGSMLVRVSSGGQQLVAIFDMIFQPSDLSTPHKLSVFDADPELGAKTRTDVLSQLAPENPIVFTNHFPFPGLGHISRAEEGWCWNPVDGAN